MLGKKTAANGAGFLEMSQYWSELNGQKSFVLGTASESQRWFFQNCSDVPRDLSQAVFCLNTRKLCFGQWQNDKLKDQWG